MNIPCENCNHKNVCENTFDPYYYSECEYYEEPRPHGTWIQTYSSIDGVGASRFKCSKCENEISKYGKPYNFCPVCGSDNRKMGDTNDQL